MEQETKTPANGMRQLLELAISCGRSWQSPQTGYIHYCYNIQDEDVHHPIPTLENILFALALMRSRNTESVNEAKEMLNRLLDFQNQEEGFSRGNFPIYLHEYTSCKDRLLGAHLLAPLYWIYKGFHHVLGADLKKRLETSLNDLVKHCLRTHKEKAAPYHIALKIGCGAKAVGILFKNKDFEGEGESILSKLESAPDLGAWSTPVSIGDILTGLQMVYPSIPNSPWKPFWEHISHTWHKATSSYAGPGWKEYQKGLEPQPTLYDYYLGFFGGSYNYRSFFDHPIQLYGALVQQTEDSIVQKSFPRVAEGDIDGQRWKVVQNDGHAYALLARKGLENQVLEKTFFPLKLLWGNSNRVHSFVCQGGNCEELRFDGDENKFDIEFVLPKQMQVEDREKNREVGFFLDEQEGITITVDGQASTTFQLKQEVVINTKDLKISLTFQVVEGDGQFFGHIMKGNRPAQVSLKGSNRFTAYDWQIFLRTVRRSERCVVKASVNIIKP